MRVFYHTERRRHKNGKTSRKTVRLVDPGSERMQRIRDKPAQQVVPNAHQVPRMKPRSMSQRMRPSHTLGHATTVIDFAALATQRRSAKSVLTKKGPREIIFNDPRDHTKLRRIAMRSASMSK